MNESFERSARRVLQAYPPRYRDVRGDELLDLVRDLAAPGATRVPWRTQLDLVRGAVAFRLRDRPPTPERWGYRALDQTLPPRWGAWVRDDIASRSYPLRSLRVLTFNLPLAAASSWFGDTVARYSFFLLCVLWVVGAVLAMGPRSQSIRRQRAREKHGIGPDGQLLARFEPPDRFAWVWRTAVRRQVWPSLLAVGVAGLGLSFALAITDGLRGSAEKVWLTQACSGLAGLVVVAAVARRMRRRLDDRQLEAAPWNTRADEGARRRTRRLAIAGAVLVYAASWLAGASSAFGWEISIACAVVCPWLVVSAVVGRAVEARSGVVVAGDELLLAAFGWRPIRGRSSIWTLTRAPQLPPAGVLPS